MESVHIRVASSLESGVGGNIPTPFTDHALPRFRRPCRKGPAAPERWWPHRPLFVCQLGHRLARGVALGDLPALAGIKCGGAAELLAVGAGAGDAFLAPCGNQLALELCDPAHDRDDQLANVGRGVAPGLTKADEAAGAFLRLMQDVEEVTTSPRGLAERCGERTDSGRLRGRLSLIRRLALEMALGSCDLGRCQTRAWREAGIPSGASWLARLLAHGKPLPVVQSQS
jgi:hypothetical protein